MLTFSVKGASGTLIYSAIDFLAAKWPIDNNDKEFKIIYFKFGRIHTNSSFYYQPQTFWSLLLPTAGAYPLCLCERRLSSTASSILGWGRRLPKTVGSPVGIKTHWHQRYLPEYNYSQSLKYPRFHQYFTLLPVISINILNMGSFFLKKPNFPILQSYFQRRVSTCSRKRRRFKFLPGKVK